MKTYLNYFKDALRLLLTILAALIIAGLHTHLERQMGLAILLLLLWVSFLLDTADPRHHARATRLLTKTVRVQFIASLPHEFVALAERVEKLAKSGITLDDLFPVDGVAPKAQPAVGGVLAEDESDALAG